MDSEFLDSWKKISVYVGREVRTCCKWEKELGLPVHRIDPNSPRSKVFAYKSEIDAWLRERSNPPVNTKRLDQSQRKRNWITWGLTLLSCSLIALVARYSIHKRTEIEASVPQVRLAILPFQGQDSSPDNEKFAERVAADIAGRLAVSDNIKVIPPSLFLREKIANPAKNFLAKDLSVDYVLEGSAKKDNSRFELSVEILNAKNRARLWSSAHRDVIENIFYVESSICKSLSILLGTVNKQSLSFLPKAERAPQTRKVVSYSAESQVAEDISQSVHDPWKVYFQAKYFLEASTEDANKLAINLFNKALEIDSNFALGYIGLAECYSNIVNFSWDSNPSWLQKAETLLDTAQKLSPGLAEYYAAKTELLLIKDVYLSLETKNSAFESAQEGIAKYPNDSSLNSLLGYCYYLKFGQKGDESDFKKALEYKEKSFWLKPFSLNNIVFVDLLILNRQFDKAMGVCNIIQQSDATIFSKLKLAEVYYYSGDLEQSKSILEELKNASLELKIDALFYKGMIAAQKGEKEKALEIVKKIRDISPAGYIKSDNLKMASIYAGIGMYETCRNHLRALFASKWGPPYRHVYLGFMTIDKNFKRLDLGELFPN
jgi:TolB-like protein